MKIKPVSEIREFLEKIAASMDIELVDVEWNDRDASLTVYIDTVDGVDLNTCEKFHNAILEPIDELDPTYDAPYTLNVSSPGLDRPFKTERDFARNLNKEIEIKLFAPLKGKKYYEGVLLEKGANTVKISSPSGEESIETSRIAFVRPLVRFE